MAWKLRLEFKTIWHPICFLFVGLSSNFKIPVGYFYTAGLTGQQLHLLTIQILQDVEKVGFTVVRLVTDNYKTNVSLFRELCGGCDVEPVILHTLDKERKLFLSYDFCHILKNLRNQFVSTKRCLKNCGENISIQYLTDLQNLQEQLLVKPVRNLSSKHLQPNNFQKMNVKLAVELFLSQTIAALKLLKEHGSSRDTSTFVGYGATIKFMEVVNEWFQIHNVKNGSSVQKFFSANDERLTWLESDCLSYFDLWKSSASNTHTQIQFHHR